jgi:glycosyltransferase involved in cell wall biosynthesis
MNNLCSVVIRTYNEERYLPQLLQRLRVQKKYINEVIVVDSGSTDSTLAIAEDFNCQIIRIPHADFSYSYALNVGIEQAKSLYISIFSAHSIPVFDDFYRKSFPYLKLDKVAGVYGYTPPLDNASLTEKIYYSLGYLSIYKKPQVIDKSRMGIMGNTNSLIPKRLWEEHRFDLGMSEGGEDAEWANYWLSKGYKFICEPRLSVYHSHGLSFKDFLSQRRHWQKVYNQAVGKYE